MRTIKTATIPTRAAFLLLRLGPPSWSSRGGIMILAGGLITHSPDLRRITFLRLNLELAVHQPELQILFEALEITEEFPHLLLCGGG